MFRCEIPDCLKDAVAYQREVGSDGKPITYLHRVCYDHKGRTIYEGNVKVEVVPMPRRDDE